MNEWQPIETAPKDGTYIVGWCVHNADPMYNGESLTAYGCHCDGLSHVEDGPHIVNWIKEYQEGDWESGYYLVPGWWFLSNDCEICANPTHWMPLPEPPKQD